MCNFLVSLPFLVYWRQTDGCLIYSCPVFHCPNFRLSFYPRLQRCCHFFLWRISRCQFSRCPIIPLPIFPVAQFSVAFFPLQFFSVNRHVPREVSAVFTVLFNLCGHKWGGRPREHLQLLITPMLIHAWWERLYNCRQQATNSESLVRSIDGDVYNNVQGNSWEIYAPCRFIVNPSTPAVPNYCCSKGAAPYWSYPPFLIFDIRVLWPSVLSTIT